MTRPNRDEALAYVTSAKARGARVLCSRCKSHEATWLLSCPDGTLQGTACVECWKVYEEFVEFNMILKASGVTVDPFCSACEDQAPATDHIVRTEIA